MSLAYAQTDEVVSATTGRRIAMGVFPEPPSRDAKAATDSRPAVAALPRWRLKRAVDYIEAHIEGPVSLAELASAAGLSRMHFAAQFKVATGMRPREYLLRRRIERAQRLLLNGERSLVDIALSVGFQTQSHFTTVFKRFGGQPPRAWRDSHRDLAS